jgi:hypothetical protein
MNFNTYFKLLLSVFIIISISACQKESVIEDITYVNNNVVKKYLHISHTRLNSNPGMVDTVSGVDYKKFDMLWLGGDLTHLTSSDYANMDKVDDVFNLSNNTTLWSLGNHDYTNISMIEEYTERPAFYAYYQNGITFLVLDTQDSLSSMVSDQLKLLTEVTDTISVSSHLIILHHKLIWMSGNEELEPQISTVSNAQLGSCFYCINPNNFYSDVYPNLIAVKQRGINVICIAGDIGNKVKEFEYLTPEGVYFIASGMSYQHQENKGLVFTHNVTTNVVDWAYKRIGELLP